MDINLVSHAKDYIDDLDKGINPFTKEEINEYLKKYGFESQSE